MSLIPTKKRKAPDTDTEATKCDETAVTPSSLPSTALLKNNAFTALMGHKQPPPKKLKNPSFGKNGLGIYLKRPGNFPPSEVISYNERYVYIWDLYPKSSVHALLLPRDEKISQLTPHEAFKDPNFVKEIKDEAAKLKTLVAKELKRRYGRYSATDKARVAYDQRLAKDEIIEGEVVPPSRIWESSVKVGFHMSPSMNHLHIHVLSVDNYSVPLKKAKHYNSFNTPFFVELSSLPLETQTNENERIKEAEDAISGPLICWRCGKSFDRRFKELKEHLAIEFEAWKQV